MPVREPTFIAAVGMTGVGKTYQNLIQIRSVLLGNAAKGVPPRKVLILDNNMEYHNNNDDVKAILHPYGFHIKTIHYKQTPQFTNQYKIEVVRIIPINDNGQQLIGKEFGDSLNYVLLNFKGGLIVAEDFKSYTGNSLNEKLIGQLITRRHKGCDTLVSLQHLRMIQPALMAVLKWIRLHESSGGIDINDEKFANIEQMINVAQNIIKAKFLLGGHNERYFLKLQLQRQFIQGYYTQQDFEDAACKYIFENWSKTVGKKMQWRNKDTGKKIFNDKTALQEVLKEYTYRYSMYSDRHKKL